MKDDLTISKRIGSFFLDHIVTIVFIAFAVFGYYASADYTPSSFFNEITIRFFRNALLVLSLIIPVIAGLGLNFGIVVGALAGMLAVIFVRYNMLTGLFVSPFGSLMLCFLIALPIALLFGWLTGKLYNKTRGQEMVASLMVGFFAEGVYMIILLFVIGGLIPVTFGHQMINPSGIGIRSTFDMGLPAAEINLARGAHQLPGMSRALTGLWRVEFLQALIAIAAIILVILIVRRIIASKNKTIVQTPFWMFCVRCAIYGGVLIAGLATMLQLNKFRQMAEAAGLRLDQIEGVPTFITEINLFRPIPAITAIIIVGFCMFNAYFLKTKLGQDCRSVGQSQPISNAAGIDVDKTRIIATMLSTVLAAWGMIIYLQDMGTVSAYTAQRQIGMFSVATLLVGGATVSKASARNVILGLILFHSMFIVSPGIGRLFPTTNENVGEYILSFMVYAVIGISLGLHVWKTNKAARDKERLNPQEISQLDEARTKRGTE